MKKETRAKKPARRRSTEATGSHSVDGALATQRAKNTAAMRLLKAWLADESGYDEAAWPVAKEAIEAHWLSSRKRFSD